MLLGIDPQNSFVSGSLQVKGAYEDIGRLLLWAYPLLGYIKQIVLTSDMHHATMVSHPHFLVDQSGNHPVPMFTVYNGDDFRTGKWRVNPSIVPMLPGDKSEEFINEFLAFYCDKLAELGRPELRTWFEHCMYGSHGQSLVGVVEELLRFHEYLRGSFNPVLIKGQSPFLECFSAYGPDIQHFQDGTEIPGAVINSELLTIVDRADAVIVFGEASSHCVPATVNDLLTIAPRYAQKIYMLEDCMSPVETLEFLADNAKKKFQDHYGVHYVTTTLPIESWPGPIPELLARIDRDT